MALSHSPSDAAAMAELRDRFAAHIIGAMIVAPKQPGVVRPEMDAMARAAYDYADAMMRARTGD